MILLSLVYYIPLKLETPQLFLATFHINNVMDISMATKLLTTVNNTMSAATRFAIIIAD
jgi:hypothetical protein